MPFPRFQRTTPPSCRPYTEAWIHGTLAPFAGHYQRLLDAANVDAEVVLRAAQIELLDLIYPFVRSEIQRFSRSLPSTADVHALEEAVLDAAMRAVAGFTPAQYLTWPALLKTKLTVAPVEAARVDSRISRRHAKLAAAFRAAEEIETQRKGRTLTPAERDRLADEVTPRTRRENWPQIVQQSVRVYQVDALPDEGRQSADLIDSGDIDAGLHADELRKLFHAEVVRLPVDVQRVIYEELDRIADGSEPRASVVRRVQPHLPAELRLYVV